MGLNNREIETKLIVSNSTLSHVNTLMEHLFSSQKKRMVFGYSRDTYWAVAGKPATFERARERDGIVELTVKTEDTDSITDRLEIDVGCIASIEQVVASRNEIHGLPLGIIEKTYYVYWITDKKEDTVCCYQATVDGKLISDIYIEVESGDKETMRRLVAEIESFYGKGINITKAPGSLYTMHLKPKLGSEFPNAQLQKAYSFFLNELETPKYEKL